MQEPDVLDLFERVGAFRKGHFVFTSGRHADTYINKDAIYPYTRETSVLCEAMAEQFKNDRIDVVVGPAVGAAVLSQWTAFHLSQMNGRDVLAVYADKDGQGGFILKRGYDRLSAGKRVLVVEDLVTTGGSVLKVVSALREVGAEVVGVSVVANRGNVKAEQVGSPARFTSLVHIQLDSWSEEECAQCARGVPVNTDVGHGREYLSHKA